MFLFLSLQTINKNGNNYIVEVEENIRNISLQLPLFSRYKIWEIGKKKGKKIKPKHRKTRRNFIRLQLKRKKKKKRKVSKRPRKRNREIDDLEERLDKKRKGYWKATKAWKRKSGEGRGGEGRGVLKKTKEHRWNDARGVFRRAIVTCCTSVHRHRSRS